jgi:hypothetical protein
VLQRKNDTANLAAEIVPKFVVLSRLKVMLEPDAPSEPLSVPVSDVSSRREAEPSPPETEKNTAVRVVSTVDSVAVPVAFVPVIVPSRSAPCCRHSVSRPHS